ncbi:uncharacterized protein KGF55_000855 [Candida pseudojiufengensis]|uniref:uncharacterized protein n=1 Tax=Candida pseudojiufengensis TaxID=497109 RepID=UPI0022240B47|nr:uncharacterized protein KGF55_000855 [Candida pseudojiufengensis]KAI5966546.1 hypothetical protein KGF55_000855 [Candida pseudojiufengensis]
MSFEILIIPNSWFRNPNSDFTNLRYLINKGYDKPVQKYGIIQTKRIISNDSFFENLAVLPNDELNLFLLLGSNEKIEELEKNGVYRDFKNENIDNAFECDIPKEFGSLFSLNELSDSRIRIVDEDFKFDDNILKRVLTLFGLRTYNYEVSNQDEINLNLTTFCSFLYNSASTFFEIIISKCLKNSKIYEELYHEPLSNYKSLIIHADCIIEHNLIDYYITKCKFKKSHKANISIENAGISYKQIKATKNFEIGFLYRRIEL